MEYPKKDASPETWIEWYRWKIHDMDVLLQAAYRECEAWKRAAEIAQAEVGRLQIEIDRLLYHYTNGKRGRPHWAPREGMPL